MKHKSKLKKKEVKENLIKKDLKQKLKERKGITLIALIVTIIVLLILAGISIGAITGDNGIINQAQNAKNDTEYSQWEEQIDVAIVDAESKHRNPTWDDVIEELKNKDIIDDESQVDDKTGAITTNEPSYVIEDKLNDYIELPTIADEFESGEIQIGDYVLYEPTEVNASKVLEELYPYTGYEYTPHSLSQEKLNWRVFDITENGNVRIISETPTTSLIDLGEGKGYNNAVYVIDKVCEKLYTNPQYAKLVQNVKIEDIQEKLNTNRYDYRNYSNSYAKYGEIKEFTYYKRYPILFAKEKTGFVDGIQGSELDLSEQTKPIDESTAKANNSIKATQTYWTKYLNPGDYINNKYYTFFSGNTSFLSSRCVNIQNNYVEYGISKIDRNEIDFILLCSSKTSISTVADHIRPIVTLKKEVEVDTSDITNDGSIEYPWKLK